jgi:hypothetical protein
VEERVPVAAALLVGILCLVTGAAVSVLNRRAADGRLGRNGVAGIRTPATMRSDAAWRAGHAAARGLSDVAAAVFALTGLAALVARDARWFAGAVLVGMTCGAAVLLVGARRAGSAADRADG